MNALSHLLDRILRHRTRRDGERGQIIVVFALFMVVILGFAALTIDIGVLRNSRQTLANAMDAGALAGGTLMPVDGTKAGAAAAVTALVRKTVEATYPGIVYDPAGNGNGDYKIEYRCLIGWDVNANRLRLTDVPIVCDPHNALGIAGPPSFNPPPTAFIGAGDTRSSICRPDLGDKCNVVVLTGDINVSYTFARPGGLGVDGIAGGNTSAVTAAACNGPCGEPPEIPLDVVMILDRTLSMSQSGDIPGLRDAARSVLLAYDPRLQHVALGLIGPSSTNPDRACSGTIAGTQGLIVTPPPVPAQPTYAARTSASSTGNASALTFGHPAVNAGDLLLATVTVRGGSNVTITPPGASTPTTADDWTQIRQVQNGTNVRLTTFYRVATGTEPANYTWSFSQSTRSNVTVMRFTDVVAGNPIIDSSGNAGNGGSNPRISVPGFNAGTNDTTLVGVVASNAGGNNLFGALSGMTEQFESSNTSTPGTSGPSSAVDIQSDVSGTFGTKTATAPNDAWAAQVIALRRPTPPVVPVGDLYGTNPSPTGPDIGKWIPVGLSGTTKAGDTPPPAADLISQNYRVVNANGTLGGLAPQNTSTLVKAIACFDASTSGNNGFPGTNLATPMEMARVWLQTHGRPGVKKGIIFETDGQPQISTTSDTANYRCDTAAEKAKEAKDASIEVFTIGFGFAGNPPNCPDTTGTYRGLSPTRLLSDMASTKLGGDSCSTAAIRTTENADKDHFYCAEGIDLTAVFQQVAAQLADLRSHLVQVYPLPSVTTVTGTANPGDVITVTGENFTGVTRVTFGGTAGEIVNPAPTDTSIRVRVPAGNPDSTVHVRVTTPGGTSPTVDGDRFHYLP